MTCTAIAISKTNLFKSKTTSIMNLLSFITLFPFMRIQFEFLPNSEALAIEIIYQRFANDFGAFDIVVCRREFDVVEIVMLTN